MLQNSPASLWEAVGTSVDTCDPIVSSAEASLLLRDLLAGSLLGGRSQELCGGSVLIAIIDQLMAVAALIELDGVAIASFYTHRRFWARRCMGSHRRSDAQG
jgi:hypothetical protein